VTAQLACKKMRKNMSAIKFIEAHQVPGNLMPARGNVVITNVYFNTNGAGVKAAAMNNQAINDALCVSPELAETLVQTTQPFSLEFSGSECTNTMLFDQYTPCQAKVWSVTEEAKAAGIMLCVNPVTSEEVCPEGFQHLVPDAENGLHVYVSAGSAENPLLGLLSLDGMAI
jgi:hypothetical protein